MENEFLFGLFRFVGGEDKIPVVTASLQLLPDPPSSTAQVLAFEKWTNTPSQMAW